MSHATTRDVCTSRQRVSSALLPGANFAIGARARLLLVLLLARLLLLPQLVLPSPRESVRATFRLPLCHVQVSIPASATTAAAVSCPRLICLRLRVMRAHAHTTILLYSPTPPSSPFPPASFFCNSPRPGVRHPLLRLRLHLPRRVQGDLFLPGLGRDPRQGHHHHAVSAAGRAAVLPRGARADGRRARSNPPDAAGLGVAGRATDRPGGRAQNIQ